MQGDWFARCAVRVEERRKRDLAVTYGKWAGNRRRHREGRPEDLEKAAPAAPRGRCDSERAGARQRTRRRQGQNGDARHRCNADGRKQQFDGGASIAAKIFPSTYFQAISVGTFTKALGLAALWPNIVALTVIAIIYFCVSVLLLKKQER